MFDIFVMEKHYTFKRIIKIIKYNLYTIYCALLRCIWIGIRIRMNVDYQLRDIYISKESVHRQHMQILKYCQI